MTDYVRLTTPGAGNYTVTRTGVHVFGAIGPGVGATTAGFFPGKGGGGGAYAAEGNVALTRGDVLPWTVGEGYVSPNGVNQGTGGSTWIKAPGGAIIVSAEGGNAYTGGSTGGSTGSIKYKGGDSGHPVINGKGPGGGGAGGPNGAGADGNTTHGGAGDGGLTAGPASGDGAAGLSMAGGLVGPGSGGAPDGGDGGRYGAGGGPDAGLPGDGLIVITLPPLPPRAGQITAALGHFPPPLPLPPPPPPPPPALPSAVMGKGWTKKKDWSFGTSGNVTSYADLTNVELWETWSYAGTHGATLGYRNEVYPVDQSPNFVFKADHAEMYAIHMDTTNPAAVGSVNSFYIAYPHVIDCPGYYEGTFQVPKVQGMWPAWWCVGWDGSGATWGPEIDGFEFYNTATTHVESTLHSDGISIPTSECFVSTGGQPPNIQIDANAHYFNIIAMGQVWYPYPVSSAIDFAADYHRFGWLIDNDKNVSIWIDDVKIATFASDRFAKEDGTPVTPLLYISMAVQADAAAADFGPTPGYVGPLNKFCMRVKNVQFWGA